MNRITRTSGLAALALTMSLGMAACGSGDDTAASDSASPSPSSESSESMSQSPATESSTEDSMDAGADTFGSGCSAIPADGAGSFNGMATEPVATAGRCCSRRAELIVGRLGGG